jgi:tRNA-dihydrouridine synthase B
MIGRGCYGRPWFVADVMHYLATGERRAAPPLDQQLDTILGHYHAMLDHYGVETGVKCARKHLGWYTKGLPGSATFRQQLFQMEDPAAVEIALKNYYLPLFEQAAA